MIGVLRKVGLACAVTVVGASAAVADPIHITSGSLQFGPGISGIPVTLSGENFTFTANAGIAEGIFTPRDLCGVPVCAPGSTVDLRSSWLGMAFHSATVTYNGETFANVGSLSSTSSMRTDWTGSLSIPTGFSGGTLTAPVALLGEFAFLNTTTFTTDRIPLLGTGTATLGFVPYSDEFPNAFRVQSLRFDVADAAAPTPEPASMLLLGTGLVGMAAARRRQRG